MEKKSILFRKKSLDRISEPDQLTDYLRVTKPMVWLVLAAILVMLLGLLFWSLTGTIDITAEGVAVIADDQATVTLTNNEKYQLEEGMKVIIGEKETIITETEYNEFGYFVGYAPAEKSDGSYIVSIVVRSAHPFKLLFG